MSCRRCRSRLHAKVGIGTARQKVGVNRQAAPGYVNLLLSPSRLHAIIDAAIIIADIAIIADTLFF